MVSKKKLIVVNYVAKHGYPYVYKIVESIAKKNEHTVAIVSEMMPELPEWKKIKGLELIIVKGYTNPKNFIPNMIEFKKKQAPKIMEKLECYEEVTILNPMFTYWTNYINRCFKRYSYVYVLHDPKPHNSRLIVHNILNEILVRNAKKIVILSEVFKKFTMEHYRKKENDIVIIPEGSNVQIDRNSAVQLVAYKDDITYFLIQGRIDKYKGIDILVKAFKKISEEYGNVALVIAGSGDITPYKNEINGQENVFVVNRWLTNEEVIGFYNDKNVIAVLPYISATQSGVINVAMPCGTPIIASNCGGIPEQIEDGVNGYLVTPSDIDDLYNKMKYVLNHKNELEIIRENGYKRVNSLDWDKLACRFLEIM